MTTQELQALKNKFDIIGNDPALNRALEIAVAVAPTDLTVLITGESGVGKENIPKIIHQNSLRRTGKYFAINCGAIPEGTIDSELFGHEKGSFTGAGEMRRGYFEEADGGTLFLDEVGELPLPSQAKLLRVLQSGEFIRVGSSKVLKTDVRVVAATNVNLRYKLGKNLNFNPKEVLHVPKPESVGLPSPNVSTSYVFASGSDFFAYPNNYNYYVSYYKDTFQHGGISMEEMLVPIITMQPK